LRLLSGEIYSRSITNPSTLPLDNNAGELTKTMGEIVKSIYCGYSAYGVQGCLI